MNPNLQRALLLAEQGRHEMALPYFQQCLGDEPTNAHAHAAFALSLARLEKFDDAEAHAREAIHLEPDASMPYYALAFVLDDRNRFVEAAGVIEQAIRLEPDEPIYWALLAGIRGQQERWHEALEAADNGLQHDPTHPGCVNLRGLALQMTGRRREAVATTDAALARDPENPMSHFTRGMALLEGGQRQEAMYHFRECLRLDPNFEPAREGIVDALKAANPLYRPILKFSFWLARKGSTWGMILPIGLWVLVQVGRNVAESNPELAPYIDPFIYAYIAFIALTWLGPHIFDFVVMVHPLGRHAMPTVRKRAAWVIFAMAVSGSGLLLTYLLWSWPLGLFIGVPCLFLTIPVSGVFRTRKGWPSTVMKLIAAGCVGLVLLTFLLLVVLTDAKKFVSMWEASLWACAIASWVTIFLAPVTPKR